MEDEKDEPNEPTDIPARGGPAGTDPTDPATFPKGIEGTRGEKDSARRAREHFLKQRGLDTGEDPAQEQGEKEK
jgi:hypothetical protein